MPSTTGAILTFFLLVAPGLLFDLLAARRRVGVPESSFREVSRVVLASTVFTAAAVLLLLLASIPWREQLPDPARLLNDEQFRTAHQDAVLLELVLVSSLACTLAALTHVVLARHSPGRFHATSAWHQVLRQEVPVGRRPYVRVKTTTGSVYLGHVGAYTPTLETDGRELVLVPPLWSGRPQGPLEPVDPEWQRIVLKSEDIAVVMVTYPPHE